MKKYLCAASTALLVTAGAQAANARDSLQAATWIPPNHQVSRYLFDYWADRVADRSGGSITVDVDLGSAMVSPRGAMAELADGIVDVTAHVAQYTPTELALSNALEELGMRYSDPRVMIAASTDFGLNAPEMQAEWARNGIVFGAGYVTALYKLVCNKPITSLDDIRGAKLRLPGRAPADWANSIGAVTVALNANEQYGALDKGALTCTTTTMADTYNRKLFEVATHVTDLPITLFWAGFAWAYNPAAWADLTPAQRKSMLDAAADAIAAYVVHALNREENEARDKLAAEGVIFHQPDAGLTASIDAFRANQPAVAVDVARQAFGIENAEDIMSQFQATVDKWSALLSPVAIEDEVAFANLLRSEIFDKIDLATYPAN